MSSTLKHSILIGAFSLLGLGGCSSSDPNVREWYASDAKEFGERNWDSSNPNEGTPPLSYQQARMTSLVNEGYASLPYPVTPISDAEFTALEASLFPKEPPALATLPNAVADASDVISSAPQD